MRFDKLTTKFQQALADAQSLAARNDHPYIEPAHVLSALLGDSESGAGKLSQIADPFANTYSTGEIGLEMARPIPKARAAADTLPSARASARATAARTCSARNRAWLMRCMRRW